MTLLGPLASPLAFAGWLLCFFAVVLAVWALGLLASAPAEARLARTQARYAEDLRDLFLDAAIARQILALQFVGAAFLCLVTLLFSDSFLLGAAALVLGLLIPHYSLEYLRRSRRNRINDQLPEGISMMVGAVRSGMNLSQALRLVAERGASPLRQEFGLIAHAMDLGASIEEALVRARARLSLPSFDLVVTALLVNREKGGDVVEILVRLGESIREISRMEKKVLAETAGIRFSAKAMIALLPFLGGVTYVMDPGNVGKFYASPLGVVFLMAVIGIATISYRVIQRLASPDL